MAWLVLAAETAAQVPSPETVDQWIADLASAKEETRQTAAKQLRKYAPAVLPKLKELTHSAKKELRQPVAQIVQAIEGEDIPRLIAELGDKDLVVQVAAVKRLEQFGPVVMPQLQAAAKANKAAAPAAAALLKTMQALVEIEDLIGQLSSPMFKVRTEAADRLARAGLAAAPALQRATMSTDPEIRLRAQALLAKLVQ
jgi:hypothetical protein